MIPEIGNFALILALLLATAQAVLPIAGAASGDRTWMAVARPAARGQALFITVAFACLITSFVSNDFSVANVASNSNTQLPLHYRVAASWGSHEGSLLLWVFMLGWWTFAVSVFSRHLPDDMVARVIGVQGVISIGFLLFMLLTSNPFDRLLPAASDGRDLNPLLQDPGMVFHPPMLYMGYVGFSVAFSFAISALLGGKLDSAWARWSRPWTTLAWCFLTCGIALGSWWAYYELGWGGWWFWDPVENASFMPWLVGTALIHSLAATEKRGSFRSWTVLLAICAFSLSLLGTFLVRSGVLTSVHAFATDPKRGAFILAFLVFVIGSSLALFAWRAPKVGLGGKFDTISRESFLLLNNLLLAVAAGSVLLGTLYPMFLDALGLPKASVGPPYFNLVFGTVMAPLVFLMGIGPLARWKKAELPELATQLKWAFAVAVAVALLAPVIAGHWTPMISVGIFLASWVIASIALNIKQRVRHLRGGLLERLRIQGRSYWGMQLAHFGIAVFIVGVTIVNGYQVEQDMRMNVGDTAQVGRYSIRFDGTQRIAGPNYTGMRGSVDVTRNGKAVAQLHPEKRIYNVQKMAMTEAAIDTGPFGDIYVSLGEPIDPSGTGAWSVRVYHKPLVTWIWGGCVLMALGGALALSDRRFRLMARRNQSTVFAQAA
ncbi:MAG: heme lyase CcmF/NrfE family subunit [Burkholderiaceae bacterium]